MALEKKKKVYACIVGMLSYWKLKLDGGENKEGVQGGKVKKSKGHPDFQCVLPPSY